MMGAVENRLQKEEMRPISMKQSWKTARLGGAFIILLTVVTYIPAMRGGFIWDDGALITENRLVQARDGLYRFWCTTEASDYYPLTSTLSWLEWRLWGKLAAGYHVVNVLLHAINALLVWMVLRRLKIPGAWLAALLFALHPVNVATVAWVSEQKTTLSMLFYLMAILFYLRFLEEDHQPQAVVRAWYALSLVSFLLALLSKTAVVMLPVVLLGCVWWIRGRLRGKELLGIVPFFALSLIAGLVTIWFQRYRALAGHAIRTEGFLPRLLAAGRVPWFYLCKALLPVNLMVVYPKWNVDASRPSSYLPGLILVACFAVFWWKRTAWGRPLLFGLGYFVVTLFPVMGFFDQGFYLYSLVADHWQYYAIVAPIALVVAGGERVCRRLAEQGSRYYLGTAAAVAVLVALGAASWNRAQLYEDAERLWRDSLARNPSAWIVRINLGHVFLDEGKPPEAAEQFEQALRIEPNLYTAQTDLGVAFWRMGKPQEAIRHYEQSVQLNPDYADAHYNWGAALRRTGKPQQAIEQFQQALRTMPDDAETHNELALALSEAGKPNEAVGHWERAIQLRPEYAEAKNKLAWSLATIAPTDGGDPLRAVSLAEEACQLTENRVPTYLDTLAVAYAATGRFNDAIATAGKAVEVARAAGQQQEVSQLETRLQLYRSGRPYRLPASGTRPSEPVR